MDVFILRVDVPKEGFARKLGADETVFAAYHGAVGKVQQFIEVLLRHERDFDETDGCRLKNIAVVLQDILRNNAALFETVDDLRTRQQQCQRAACLLPHVQPLRPNIAPVAEKQPFGRVFLGKHQPLTQGFAIETDGILVIAFAY